MIGGGGQLKIQTRSQKQINAQRCQRGGEKMSFDTEIEELRNQINNLDIEILDKIVELIRTSRKIETQRTGTHALILDNIDDLAHEYSLNTNGIKRIFNAIEDLLPKTGREIS
jgi:chorismate mutase